MVLDITPGQMTMAKSLWRKFDRGDHLSDTDLKELIHQAEKGLFYLRARGEHLAAAKTAQDLATLNDYLNSRKGI